MRQIPAALNYDLRSHFIFHTLNDPCKCWVLFINQRAVSVLPKAILRAAWSDPLLPFRLLCALVLTSTFHLASSLAHPILLLGWSSFAAGTAKPLCRDSRCTVKQTSTHPHTHTHTRLMASTRAFSILWPHNLHIPTQSPLLNWQRRQLWRMILRFSSQPDESSQSREVTIMN